MQYKYSVGKVKLLQGGNVVKTILPLTDMTIDYSLSTTQQYGPDGVAIDEFKDEEKLTINISYATDQFDPSLMQGEDYDLSFETAGDGGDKGLAATLALCRLTGYRVNASQSSFSITTLTFSKRGDIDLLPGEEPTKQLVKFAKEGGGEVYIGDSAYVVTTYKGNAKGLIIPTALGVLPRSTNDLGGGELNIQIKGYVGKSTRLELEQYLITLYNQLSTGVGTLTVEYGASSYTIDNCIWTGGSPDTNNKEHTSFELSFLKSAY